MFLSKRASIQTALFDSAVYDFSVEYMLRYSEMDPLTPRGPYWITREVHLPCGILWFFSVQVKKAQFQPVSTIVCFSSLVLNWRRQVEESQASVERKRMIASEHFLRKNLEKYRTSSAPVCDLGMMNTTTLEWWIQKLLKVPHRAPLLTAQLSKSMTIMLAFC